MQLNLPWRQTGSMPGRRTTEKAPRFPNRVRDLRLAAKLTQEELAEKLGVTFSAIGKLERGETRLRIDQAQSLSKVLNVHELELLLPISFEERQALQLLRAADPNMRKRMIKMLEMMAEPADQGSIKAA